MSLSAFGTFTVSRVTYKDQASLVKNGMHTVFGKGTALWLNEVEPFKSTEWVRGEQAAALSGVVSGHVLGQRRGLSSLKGLVCIRRHCFSPPRPSDSAA